MDQICYTLLVRQRTCQNGIPSNLENTYTNVTNQSIFPLSFGYSFRVISNNRATISIELSNPNFIPNMIFNIPNSGYKVFDLPKENGTLRVYIGATGIDCQDTVVCCCKI